MGRSQRNQVPLAVVGMGCRMPGADDLDAYWRLISEGHSAISELPADRLNRELYYDPEPGKCGKSYSQIGGVVPERPIDPSICPLPENLLREFDNAHLTMCEVAASAFRHAGMDPFDLALRNVGVYIGHSGGTCLSGDLAYSTGIADAAEYLRTEKIQQLLPPDLIDGTIKEMVDQVRGNHPKRNLDGSPHVGAHSVAGLINNAFDLSGPYMAIDAACASSLIALAFGAHALQNGLIDMAVVGGASFSKWYAMVLFSMAQSMSATGSRPFDAAANGLVSSDGYAAVILKTLPRAMADGDPILAVVRGVGISSDGRGKSLWAPRMVGQIEAINRAYESGIDPSQLQYIECHATSTQVGDATELKALTEALGKYFPQGRKLPIGSVKANIGHTLECAGIAGFVKSVLAMNNKIIPRQINFETPNPEIDWDNTPFQVASQSIPWTSNTNGAPRRAAVNAFGIGGLNVHVVIDDRPDDSLIAAYNNTNGRPAATNHESIVVTQPPPQDDIAIVGMGAIVPGALTVDAFWDLLMSGHDPKSEVPPERWHSDVYYDPSTHTNWRLRAKIGGFVKDFVYDWKKHKVPPKQIASANPLQFMLLDATDQALREAGYGSESFDRSRTSVVVGNVFGGDFACSLQMGMRLPELRLLVTAALQKRGVPPERIDEVGNLYEEIILSAMPALLDETGSFTASTLASRLSKTFDLMGGALSVDAADVSSAAAIISAAGLLRTGASDMVVAAAGQRSLDVTIYEEIGLRGMLPVGELRSDDTLYGNVPAEGAGVVVLKRLEDARRDGNRIRGVIRGIATSTNSNDLHHAYQQSLTHVVQESGVRLSQIGILETARMSRTDLDSVEAAQFAEQCRREDRKSPVSFSSVSHRIGHTLGTSGMVALIKSVLELEHGQIPSGCGAEAIAASTQQYNDVLTPIAQTEPVFSTTSENTCIAAVSNLDPKGASYHILVEGGENLPAKPVAAPQVIRKPAEWRIVRISAQTADAVASRLATESAEQLFEQGSQAPFPADHPIRLAFVVEDLQSLEQKIEFAAKYLFDENSSALERHGIFYRELSNKPPKVAFVFPGQGSQYTGMMREIVEQIPAASEIVQQIDAALARHGYPSFADIVWNDQVHLGSNIGFTQLSVLLADVIAYATVSSLGIHPDVVAGHSFGEFGALYACGAISLDQAVQATRARTEAIEASPAHGCMLSTSAPAEKVQALLATRPENVAIACLNAPDQTVLGGTQYDIQVIQSELTKLGFQSRVIPVPCPFHTPLMASACQSFGVALQQIQFQTPQRQFMSTVTARFETDPDQIRGNLTEQMTATVRYVDVVRELVSSGVNVFVETGPHQVLSRLNQQILNDAAISNIAFDHKRSAVEQFYRTRALLECTGALSPLAAYTQDKRIDTIGTQPSRTQADGTSPESLIVYFDATERRKEKMRQAALQRKSQGDAARADAASPTAAPPKQPGSPSTNGNGSHHATPAASPVSATPPVSRTTGTVSPAPEPSPAVSTPVVAEIPTAELNAFMIEFIVEQTGYPEDMVDLDADLEADLGIDSIKKAQLIGELAQKYDLGHLAGQIADLSLDDFQNLRQISQFITSPGTSEPASPSVPQNPPPAATAPPAVQAPAPVAPSEPIPTVQPPSATLAPPSLVSPTSAPTTAPASATSVSQPAPPAQQAATASTDSSPAPFVQIPRAELESFTVNFIVDQTGYPEDMVEVDADLEADLGIDSIKKAQLIGELAQKYDLSHLADQIVDLSLDDFTTLGHIIDFVTRPPSETPSSAATAAPPSVAAPAAPVAPTPAVPPPISPAPVASSPAVAPAPVAPAPVTPQTIAQPTVSTPAAAAPLSATPSNGNGSSALAQSTTSAATTTVAANPVISADELDPFMINFIVDQTGYPEDMIEMDADLEADLGIDSIKKAQLIGEMAQKFELSHLAGQIADLSLDDFTTLRTISDFITQPPSADAPVAASASPVASPAIATPAPVAPAPVAPAQEIAAPVIPNNRDAAISLFRVPRLSNRLRP